MIQLNYRDAKPIYEQIRDGFKHLLVTGAIDADEKLPSVRELASTLAINPNTIQRAYHELESEGYIYVVPGKGSFATQQRDAVDIRTEELFVKFDEIVTELLYLSVEPRELAVRMEGLEEGRRSL